MYSRFLAATALLHIVVSAASIAAIPHTIAFQGVLTNSAGVPKAAGIYNVTFRLYDAGTGGSLLWTEAAKPVTVTGNRGVFSTELGKPTPFGALAFDAQYFVEVQIAGEASAMTPRIALSSVPYALNVPSATLSLPFSGTANVASPDNAMYVRNSGSGVAVQGSSDNNSGVLGVSINYDAVAGFSTTGNGVRGGSTSNKGVFGSSTNGVGTQGSSTNNIGIYGSSSKSYGVYGTSPVNFGVYGNSTSLTGVYGESASYLGVNGVGHAGGLPAVFGQNDNATGDGVWGSGIHVGVWGDSGLGTGLYGLSERGQYGVNGESTLGFAGVWGHGAHNGVYGQTSSAADSAVFGRNETTGTGIFGYSVGGTGVTGRTESDGQVAVFGYTNHNNGSRAVWGANDGNGPGVQGNSAGSDGVIGWSNSAGNSGVAGINTSAGGNGVYGRSNAGGYAGYFAGLTHVGILEISGGSDVAEKFSVAGAAQPGTVVSIDPEHTGALKMSSGAYDRTVAGVISGANHLSAGMVLPDSGGVAGALPVAMAGRVWVRCNDSNGAIRSGDMLTTSDTAGVAMKVTDYARSEGATIGKAMSPLTHGSGLVLALVNLH